jgi:YhcH/YjgK/YiaL family protein
MIIDSINNCHNYFSLNTRFSTAFEYILSNDFSKFEPGRHDVDGNEIYVMVSDYNTKNISECKWEAHRKYIDIHIVAKGIESFGFANLDSLKVVQNYTDEKDVLLLEGEGDFVKLGKETFIITFPQDAHMPGVVFDSPGQVKKAVVKVKVGMFPIAPL